MTLRSLGTLVALVLGSIIATPPAPAQTTAFTYQGSLDESGVPADGVYNVSFSLWNLAVGGAQIGSSQGFPNLPITDGLFTVQLDFGTSAFTASNRWLQVVVNGQTLSPRTLITPTPYSLKTRGIAVDSLERIGIGTSSPEVHLHVEGVETIQQRLTSSNINGTWLDLQNTSFAGSTWSLISSGLSNGEGPGRLLIYSQSTGTTAAVFRTNGNIGFGTPSPKQKIHNVGDYYGRGHFWLHAFEGDGQDGTAYLQARDDSDSSSIGLTLRTQFAGQVRDAIVLSPVGSARVSNSLDINGDEQSLSPSRLYVEHANSIFPSPVVRLNRTAEDGSLIEFVALGSTRGGITVSGNTVSYNAFTGSHYAIPDPAAPTHIERGALVRMTGNNLTLVDEPDAEVVYAIAPTTTPNDPACLGAYLAAQSLPDGADVAPHLVMAAGNGDMWVTDSGAGDIEPGDALISSDVPGCAMKDDPDRFAVGHIVARAAQRVEWDSVPPGADGVRRARVSVLFGAFTRQAAAPDDRARLAALERENQDLRDRLEALEALVRAAAED